MADAASTSAFHDPLLALRDAAGAWVWDVTRDRLYADARFAALCGLDPEAARTGLPTSAFSAGIVADDRLRVRIALAGILRGSEIFSKEYRTRGIDGVVRWVLASKDDSPFRTVKHLEGRRIATEAVGMTKRFLAQNAR